MSEKIYAWLLLLYPSNFRKAYGEEALQLFRDRVRDERGFLSGLRLWLDLLRDLAISIPRWYRTVPAALVISRAEHCSGGTPSFHILEDETLSFGSLLYGGIASLVVCGSILLLIGHGGNRFPILAPGNQQPPRYSGAIANPFPSPAADIQQRRGYSGTIAKPTPTVAPSYLLANPAPGSMVSLTATVLAADAQAVTSAAAAPPVGIDGKPLTFEVVSIHEDKSMSAPQNVENGPTPDGYRLKGLPLFAVIQIAYVPSQGGLYFRPNQITGVPAWLNSIRYDIDAKVSEADLPKWNAPALQPAMLRAMLQAMLADRFKLAVHRETKVVPIYELTVGRKSPKFKPSEATAPADILRKHPDAVTLRNGTIVVRGPNPGQLTLFGLTMQDLGTFLSNLAGRPIQDKTGLTGKYDITYQIELPPRPQEGAGTTIPPDFFSSQIFTIVQDQLGLKLRAGKGLVEFLVIDHVEKPSPN